MDDKTELCWRMYAENCVQGRHHETMRAALTTLIAAIAAGALGLLKADHPICSQLPLAVLVIALGLFGAFVSRKHYERFALHMRRASAYRRKIDELVPGVELTVTKLSADKRHNDRFKRFSRVSLSWLWSSINLAVMGVGIAAVVFIQRGAQCW